MTHYMSSHIVKYIFYSLGIVFLANPLSKACPGWSQQSHFFKELKRVIKFVLDTADDRLKIKAIKKAVRESWTLIMFSDSDYAGNAQSQISVTRFCVFLMGGVPINWKSQAQRSITLSKNYNSGFMCCLTAHLGCH